MRTPTVELLWWEGCPSTERALADLHEALDELGPGRTPRCGCARSRTDAGRRAGALRRLADDPDRRARPRPRGRRRGDRPQLPRLPPSRRQDLAGPRSRRSARGAAASRRARGGRPDDACDWRRRSRFRAARHRGRQLVARRTATAPARPWSCSRATTARTRSPGTTGSPTRRATTQTAASASWRSTPTTPTATPATRSRR